MFNKTLSMTFACTQAAAALALLLLLSACGGGSSSKLAGGGGSTAPATSPPTNPTPTPPAPTGCDASTCGMALISMMDANGDFDSYTVDVTALTLKRADGTVVQALPLTTRVDFAQLVAVKELLTAANLPKGNYVSGTLSVDFTNADIEVDFNGMPVKAAVVDASGMPVTTLALNIELDAAHRLSIVPGTPALLDLDFDLNASNTVNLTTTPIEVTVQPVIVASLEPTDSRIERVRGELTSVDTIASDYIVEVLPFQLMRGQFGSATVHTSGTTDYEINGTAYTGAAGLSALAALPAATATAAFGAFSSTDRRFTATLVHAGTSVEGTHADALGGTVIARSGNELTVRGATLIRSSGSVAFMRADSLLKVGSGTTVTKDGAPGAALGSTALSVGQHVEAFGIASIGTGSNMSFDATAGRVRMEGTPVAGRVAAAVAGTLTLDVQSIDRRDVSVFDFAGTGSASATDADPTHYLIATGSLGLAGLAANAPAEVFGFVTPFGSAPPDFAAQTLANFAATRALLAISWGRDGTSTPFSADAASGIVIDTTNTSIGAAHYIEIGAVFTDLKALATPASIASDATQPGIFAIGEPGAVHIFNDFTAFTAELASRLTAGGKLVGLQATGGFDAATSVLTSQHVLVEFKSSN